MSLVLAKGANSARSKEREQDIGFGGGGALPIQADGRCFARLRAGLEPVSPGCPPRFGHTKH
jgi:hypothetical protein